MKDITIATLVYKDNRYLDFVLDSLKRKGSLQHKINYLVVANDATKEVEDKVAGLNFQSTFQCKGVIHKNKDPNEWWIQRVYNAWNRCLNECETPYICFVNNDMAFTNGWLDSLANYDTSKFIPTSRLVESERMPSLPGLVGKNFGQTLDTFDRDGFEKFAETLKKPGFEVGIGAYMPSLFDAKILRSVGGWQLNQGNVPGDRITFHLLKKYYGMEHIMVNDSIVYHFQRGESAECGDL